MKIQLSELKDITNRLFDMLEERGYSELEFNVDYYWNIPIENLYDVISNLDPNELEIRQLSEDWDWCQKALSKEDDLLNSYYFIWVSTLFRAIGHSYP